MWLFIHRPFEIWPVWGELRLERVYMLITLGYWLLAADKSWVRNRLSAAFGLLGMVLACSWLASPWRELGTKTIEDWLKVAIFYVLLLSTVRSEAELRRMLWMYVGSVGLYMAHSLWEYGNGRHAWTMGTARLLGIDITYGDPNTFAATIVYSLPLALTLWPKARAWWLRGLLASYGAMSVVAVLLTASRSGFVGLACLGAFLALRSERRLRWILLMALAATALWRYLPEDRQNRLLTLVDPSYGPASALESAEGRAKGFRDGLRLWGEYKLLGVGPGAFGTATGTGFESHHLYGQVLGELGTLGAVAFGSVLAAFLANALDARRLCQQHGCQQSDFAVRVVGATSLTVGLMLLLGLAGHNLYRYTWLWCGAFQAIALSCLQQSAWQPAVEEDGSAQLDTPEVAHA